MTIREQYKLAYAIAKTCHNDNSSYKTYEFRTMQLSTIAADNAWLSMCHINAHDNIGKRYRLIRKGLRWTSGLDNYRAYCRWIYTREI